MATSRSPRALLVSAALAVAAAAGLAVVPAPAAAELSGGSGSQAVLADRLGAAPTAHLATAPFAFASVLDGKPVRWDPCTPIRWTANVAAGPRGGLDVLKAGVARVAALTGTTWQFAGTTATVPTAGYLPRSAGGSYPPVLLGWTDGTRSDLLRGQSKSVLGMTRTAWFGVQRPDGSKVAATRAAVVALDRTDALPLRGGTSWSSVVLHELGHAMGLAHAGDTRQLMATVLPRAATDFQTGDRSGLAKLGRTAGCVTVPSL